MCTPLNDAKDLLLEDYRYRSTMLMESEKAGETRVNLFITLVVLVSGGLVSLVTSDHGPSRDTVRLIAGCALATLLAFGWLVLLRLVKRNKSTDECKHALDMIRQKFKDHFDSAGILQGYYAVNWPHPGKVKQGTLAKELRKFGGLGDLVAAINSVLIAGLTYVFISAGPIQEGAAVLWIAGITFFTALLAQVGYLRWCEHTHKAEMELLRPTHAGGVVFREANGQTLFLLVRAKGNARPEWLLPKGHVEKGEGHGECAVREVMEETGAYVRVRSVLGEWHFMAKEAVRMKSYLLQWIEDRGNGDGREKTWLPLEQAIGQATHTETKEMLREAARLIAQPRAADTTHTSQH